MISAFRNFFQSKIGLALTFVFIGLIALAFAASDISGTALGGVSGGDRVAVVGDEPIAVSELDARAQSGLRQVQAQDPTLTMAAFVEQGLLEEVLDQLIDRYAISAYAEKYGLRAGENLVNSDILNIPQFLGASGEFDQDAYRAALSRQGITDAIFRKDLGKGLLAQQLLSGAFAAPQMPAKVAKHYAALITERRRGEIALIPSSAFAPTKDPSKAQLEKFYASNKARFTRPERRSVRYAAFDVDNLKQPVTVSAAEIKQRYEKDRARYAARETRSLSSFLVPTKQGAEAIVKRLRSGVSLEQAAKDAGFQVSKVEDRTRDEISQSYSFAVAEAVFKTAQGGIADPAQSKLGFYIARVDSIKRSPAQSLAQATPELTKLIESEKTAAALANLSAQIEDELGDGSALVEVAKKYDLDVVTSEPLLADGQVFGDPKAKLPEQLRPTLETAFQMDEGKPQLTELVPGTRFLIFDVKSIEKASAPPLAQIRADVVAAWKLYEGSKAAKKSADRVLKAVRGKSTLTAAMAAEKKQFPPVDKIDLEREELLQRAGRNIPAPLVLMFSMAQGSFKSLEAPNDGGWFIVGLDEIATTPYKENDERLTLARTQLAPALVTEYTEQATKAIREEIGVERNKPAIAAIRKRLLGN